MYKLHFVNLILPATICNIICRSKRDAGNGDKQGIPLVSWLNVYGY